MNYLRALYEDTAMLLKYTIQNCDSTYEEAVSLFFYENRHAWKEDNEKKIVDVICLLLALNRKMVELEKSNFVMLEEAITSISDQYLSEHFSESDISFIKSDINTALRVIKRYNDESSYFIK